MMRTEITIPLEQANAREMMRIEINHPMITIARLRTARKSDESQNEDEDSNKNKDKKKEENKDEEKEELDKSSDYKNFPIRGHEKYFHGWGGCFINPYSYKYDGEASETFYHNKAHGDNVWCSI